MKTSPSHLGLVSAPWHMTSYIPTFSYRALITICHCTTVYVILRWITPFPTTEEAPRERGLSSFIHCCLPCDSPSGWDTGRGQKYVGCARIYTEYVSWWGQISAVDRGFHHRRFRNLIFHRSQESGKWVTITTLTGYLLPGLKVLGKSSS